MDNKLSELSKPVAWILHTRGGDVPTLDECYVANAEGMENIRSSALYSQEYVSALLAELEAKDKTLELEREKSRRVMSENHQQAERIAELEAKTAMTMGVGDGGGSLFVHGDYDSIKAAQHIVFENESLRAKLATPVRLPPLMDSELCGKYGAKYSAAANAHNNAITACSIAIRCAGFKSEATALKCVGDA